MSEKRDITGYSINARLKPKKEVEQKFRQLKAVFEKEAKENGIALPAKGLNASQVLTMVLDVAHKVKVGDK